MRPQVQILFFASFLASFFGDSRNSLLVFSSSSFGNPLSCDYGAKRKWGVGRRGKPSSSSGFAKFLLMDCAQAGFSQEFFFLVFGVWGVRMVFFLHAVKCEFHCFIIKLCKTKEQSEQSSPSESWEGVFNQGAPVGQLK